MQNNLLEYLEKTAKSFPHKVAIEDEYSSITFKQLRENALSVSNALIEAGIDGCEPIVVFMPKTIKAIEAFLGVLYAGGFYVPLDIGNPKSRIDAILRNIQPKFILSESKRCHFFDGVESEVIFVEEINVSLSSNSKTCYRNIIDTDPAYLINTSGSTGSPKGVLVSHRSIIDYIDWAITTYSIDDKSIIGNQAPFVFDNSVLDIYLMLSTGSKLVLIPEKLFMFPIQLINYMEQCNVSFIFWVPSIMSNIMKFEALRGSRLKSLKHVLFAGEVMPTKVYLYWKDNLHRVVFSNLYGPTEITVDCTFIILTRNYDVSESLPIGFPCKNTNVLLLDNNNQLVTEPDILGELCVRGSSLAIGYYNNFDKTEQVFVQNPLNSRYPERIYRTGDLAYYNDYGELMYEGRKDSQIKHNGYRIELGEIEKAALLLDKVERVCAIYDAENKSIVLVYESNAKKNQEDLLLGLLKYLPKYMLPNRFELIKSMPLNSSGKIDRQSLLDLYL